jgi:hypothetical protein
MACFPKGFCGCGAKMKPWPVTLTASDPQRFVCEAGAACVNCLGKGDWAVTGEKLLDMPMRKRLADYPNLTSVQVDLIVSVGKRQAGSAGAAPPPWPISRARSLDQDLVNLQAAVDRACEQEAHQQTQDTVRAERGGQTAGSSAGAGAAPAEETWQKVQSQTRLATTEHQATQEYRDFCSQVYHAVDEPATPADAVADPGAPGMTMQELLDHAELNRLEAHRSRILNRVIDAAQVGQPPPSQGEVPSQGSGRQPLFSGLIPVETAQAVVQILAELQTAGQRGGVFPAADRSEAPTAPILPLSKLGPPGPGGSQVPRPLSADWSGRVNPSPGGQAPTAMRPPVANPPTAHGFFGLAPWPRPSTDARARIDDSVTVGAGGRDTIRYDGTAGEGPPASPWP